MNSHCYYVSRHCRVESTKNYSTKNWALIRVTILNLLSTSIWTRQESKNLSHRLVVLVSERGNGNREIVFGVQTNTHGSATLCVFMAETGLKLPNMLGRGPGNKLQIERQTSSTYATETQTWTFRMLPRFYKRESEGKLFCLDRKIGSPLLLI